MKLIKFFSCVNRPVVTSGWGEAALPALPALAGNLNAFDNLVLNLKFR